MGNTIKKGQIKESLLPNELWEEIFSYFEISEIGNIRLVSKTWNEIALRTSIVR
jgi:hypothetical protein